MSLAWLLMFINAYFALTVKDPGIASLNLGVVIFLALHIWFAPEPKDPNKRDDDVSDE